jgi:hypothetical protein
MSFSSIANAVTSKVGTQLLFAKSHSPKVLFVAGVAGVVGTVVLACRSTMKLEEVLDEHAETLSKVEDMNDLSHFPSDREYQQAKVGAYIRVGVRVAKLYAPAFGVGLLSVAALTGSHVVLTNRNAGLTAALVATDKAFKVYRDRVRAALGDDKDREFRYGSRDVEVVEETEEGPVTKIIKRYDESVPPSQYSKIFDEGNDNWERNPESNLLFLRAQQQYATDRLRSRGYIFLNEVYKSLGLKQTRAGQIVGWSVDKGDDYVDFGVFDVNREDARDFVNGWNSRVLLDFNVAGPILNLIPENEDH